MIGRFLSTVFCVLVVSVGCKDGSSHKKVALTPVLPAGADKFAFGDTVRVYDVPVTRAAGVAGRVGNIAGFTKPSWSGEKVIGDVKDDLAFSVLFENPEAQLWFAPELLEFVSHTNADIRIGRHR